MTATSTTPTAKTATRPSLRALRLAQTVCADVEGLPELAPGENPYLTHNPDGLRQFLARMEERPTSWNLETRRQVREALGI